MDKIMYNENVLKWCGSIVDTSYDEEYDVLIDDHEDVIIYDDTEEWYNTNGG